MCIRYVDVYTVCAHAQPRRQTGKCPLKMLRMACGRPQVTVRLCLGWCAPCADAMLSRTRRAKRVRYPHPVSWLTVANYWAFKSKQGWERPVRLRDAVRSCDIDSPVEMPYYERPTQAGGNGGEALNWEEQAMLWTLLKWAPARVLLQTGFVDARVSMGGQTWRSAIAGLVREARYLTLTEWSAYPNKEDVMWAACQRGFGSAPMFGSAVRQEYFLSDAMMDGVPVWEPGFVPVSVDDDPAIVHKGEIVRGGEGG